MSLTPEQKQEAQRRGQLQRTMQALEAADPEQVKALYSSLAALAAQKDYDAKYSKLGTFTPYEYQRLFFAAGATYRQRFLCAGNRIGKTYGAAREITYHLTGHYPDWWQGARFDTPILAWCVGITTDSTRKVMQKELFGTETAKFDDEIGTGTIPRDLIEMDLIERDGNMIKVAKIKHASGGHSTLEFRSTQQGEHVLMGASVDIIWLDEEDPYRSIEIFAQCVTRTAESSTKPQGYIIITATPENGVTGLVKLFMMNESGRLYFQKAGWNDVTHISEEAKKDLLAGIPQWQWPMRMHGEPLLGDGLVFAGCSMKDMLCDPFQIPDHWPIICGVDIGITHYTAATWCAWDFLTDTIYVFDHYRHKGEQPVYHAAAIRQRGDWIPVILPHDADNTERGSGNSVAMYYREAGVNALHDTFYNPPVLTQGKKNNFVNIGITDMTQRINTGRLRIFNVASTLPLRQEFETYQYRDGKIYKVDDDSIDSCRYAVMSVTHRGQSRADHDAASLGYFMDDDSELAEW